MPGAVNDTVSTQLGITSASGMTVPEPLLTHDFPGREDKMVGANKMILRPVLFSLVRHM